MNGSIRRRSKGSWQITIDLGFDAAGKRRRKYASVKGNKGAAQKRLRELLTSLDKGMALDSTKATVGEFLERWLTDYAETNTSPRTVMGYREKVRNYLYPYLGHFPLAKLTPQHVQNLYSEMLGRGLSARTVVLAHRILREALKHAVKWGLLMRNVCDAVDPPKPQNREMAALDAVGVEKFLDSAASTRYGAVFFLALYTGMRRSELLGLRWTAVDLNAKTVSVVETLQRILGKGMMTLQPKTAKSRRLVNLPPAAAALLSGLRTKQQDIRQTLGLEWRESDYVFSLPDGRPYSPDKVSLAFADVIKKAGLPHIRLHDLRHTHATMMMAQGVNPKTVAERLGHASVVITLDTYSHVLPGLQEEAALKFEEGLRRAS